MYGYNTDVPQFFTDILYKSAEFANTSYLFCGDWNAVQNKSDDTYNVLHDRNINARKKIDEMKETFELLVVILMIGSTHGANPHLLNRVG